MSDEKRLPPWRLRWDDEREWVTQNQATLPGRVFGHYYEYVTGEWGAVTETDAGAVETEHATASEAREACEARLRDLEYVVLHAPRRVAPIPSGTPRHTVQQTRRSQSGQVATRPALTRGGPFAV